MDASSMMASPKQEIKLADYQPPAFFIDNITLTFKIYGDYVDVHAKSFIKRNGNNTNALALDGSPYMELLNLSIDGEAVDKALYTLGGANLTINDVPDEFIIDITTRLKPAENSRLEGLYASGGNLCTQCEAEGFRHITYYIDRPDVLAVYSVRIEADKDEYPVLLSNGDNTENGILDNNRHYACWNDPYPKPSYLFALVAGKLSAYSDRYVTKSGREVALNIYVREPDLDKCDYAMQSLKRSMKWDEDEYGLEYDLGTYNIVAVSDFNMGAMENKGLNVFNTKYVLANQQTATDTDFDNVEGVIGHEYFHNWTGNRVTCRDWFQLSLKEGLTVFRDQEFSSDMTSRAVKRIADVRVLRMIQFPEDAGPLAHPIRPESYVEINNFYTATVYNKGAEVIRMIQALLGKKAFNTAVRQYLTEFDGQAATCADFVDVMERVGQKDLTQFRRWYSQAGTPSIDVSRKRDGNDVILKVSQSCMATPGQSSKAPFHIPFMVGWIDKAGEAIFPDVSEKVNWTENGCLLDVTAQEQEFKFYNVPEDCVPSLHRGFSAPVTLTSDISDEEKAFLVSHDSDAYARWQAIQELASSYILNIVEGEMSIVDEQYQLIASAFSTILQQENIDLSFMAELLTLPTEVYLGQLQDTLQPDAIYDARESLLGKLANDNEQSINNLFAMFKSQTAGQTQSAKGARRLCSVLLSYMIRGKSEARDSAKEEILSQFYKASTMTEQLSALMLISDSDYVEREDVLKHFYEQWQTDDLVIDKWFAVQAQSKRLDTLDTVKHLMCHEAFSYQNPNRIRSLVSSFTMMNQVRFHSADGAGYSMLSNVIKKLDKINPQTAARMVAPLCRWQRLDSIRQTLMIDSLKELLNVENLSDDVRELVQKSLQ
ncbi:aminopeptidase N [Kordiimonas aquimaris]|uniref:aminopeptidase N n=1 Tax=Kordiimonas aquimaris TaxID=707591 RepID=UPI0021CF9C25|nr:aminopeptidase N [Kordiimonas aquimaris]